MTQTENTQTQEQEILTNAPQTSRADLWEKILTVNALLQAQEPSNISVDSYNNFTGYKPQSVKNAMNEVFGADGWGYEEILTEERAIKTRDGETLLSIAKVEVWIDGVKRRTKAWGQALVTKNAIGDSRKGALTDGMKKGLSDFSIGSRAFEGKLSREDAEAWEQQQKEEARARQDAKRAAASNARKQEERRANPPAVAQTSRPAQAASAPAQTKASAHREPITPTPVSAPVQAPTQTKVATMDQLIQTFTKYNPLDGRNRPIMWTTYMHDVLREEIAAGEIDMPTLLNSSVQPPEKYRLKLTAAVKQLKANAKQPAPARS